MSKFRELVGIAIGRASMAWSEKPTGVFDSETCSELCDEIVEEYEKLERKNRYFNCYSVRELVRDEKKQFYIMAPNDKMALEFAWSEGQGHILEIIRTNMDCFIIDYKEPCNEDSFESSLIGQIANI